MCKQKTHCLSVSEIVQTKTKYSVMNIPKYMEALGGRLLNRFD